ncbi:DUF4363 family protein [Pseudoflavonifractor phocaeensis]|uniref:DUF4363 family protein n=1 Tax=Pseudoflavonifractor phocaeensis TaxID=1870988 RepID=UPI001FAFFB8D|nr:DUF4363 family protein [Pseudoflavonifractor phocaeensis]
MMKRLWLAAALLAAALAVTIWNARHLDGLTGALIGQLEEARQLVSEERWQEAEQLVKTARDRWRSHDTYLHVTLRHGDTDEIQLGFEETLRLLQTREVGEYAAASAQLMGRLSLLSEAEQLTLENLF